MFCLVGKTMHVETSFGSHGGTLKLVMGGTFTTVSIAYSYILGKGAYDYCYEVVSMVVCFR